MTPRESCSHCMIFKVIGSPLFSHCTTIWYIIDYHSVAAVFTLHDGSVTRGYTLHDFTIGRIADSSVWSANYSQTHMRSVKEIKQNHADIVVYKSSPNTQ